MKNFKLIFILAFILLIISMGCVSATDSGDIAVSDVAYSFDDSLNTQTVAVSDYSLESDDSTLVDDLDEDNVYADDIFEDSYSNSEDIVYDSSFSRFKDNSISSLGASKTSTKIVASDLTMSYYDGHKLIATIKTSDGKAIKGLKVTFKVNGVTYNRTSNASGKIVLGITNGITLAPGTYSCVIKFAGTSAYAASSKTVTVTVNKWGTKLSASNCAYDYGPGKLVATLQNSSGKGINGKSLSFTINGKTYTAKTAGDGKATLSLPALDPGSYSCVIKYGGDKVNNTCSKTVTVTVNKWSSKLVVNNIEVMCGDGMLSANLQLEKNILNLPVQSSAIFDRNNETYSCVDCGGGKSAVVLPNQNIIFSINSKDYAGVTDAKGNVFLDLSNLDPGNYSCNIKFNGAYYSYGCSKTVMIKVNKLNSKIILDNVIERSSNCVLVAKLVDENNNGICNKVLNFVFNNNSFKVKTDSSGNAVLDVSSVVDDYFLVDVKFDGDNGYYGSNNSVNVSILNGSSPFAWASNGSGIYNSSFYVNLSSLDNFDNNPTIFYTLDGTLPTIFSPVYNGSIFISNQSNHTILRFFAMDNTGHQSSVVCVHYFFGNLVVNLNNGKIYDSVQSAIDDDETSVGDVIEVSCDLNESVVLNKRVYLCGSTLKEIFWTNDCSDSIISFEDVDGAIVEGFIFVYRSPGYSAISLVNSSNCFILNNVFFNTGHYSIYCEDNSSVNNSIISNRFFGNVNSHIFIFAANNYLFMDNILNNSNMIRREYYRGISDSLNFNSYYSYDSGICVYYSMNSIFKGNLFVNGDKGIYIQYGDNNLICCNDISLCDNGILCCGNNNELVNNTISRNNFGIDIYGYGNSILSNNIVDNQYGVYSNDSDNLSVNWNRFSSNSCFGLYVLSGSVDATHNWWGRSNVSAGSVEGSDIYYTSNIGCIYEPYLVMKLIRTDFTIEDGVVKDCRFVVDLNWDSDDVYVRNLGHVADGATVSFLTTFSGGRPFSADTLKSGLAISTPIPSWRNGSVHVYLDNEHKEMNIVECLSSAVVTFNTSAHVLNNSFSNFSFLVNLIDSVDWISFVWKDLGNFKSEVNILVNGNIFKTFVVESSFYHNNPYNVSENVFKAIDKYNSFLYNRLGQVESRAYVFISLDYGVNTLEEVEDIYFGCRWRNYTSEVQESLLRNNNITVVDALLKLIKNSFNLSDYEINFVRNHHDDVKDFICVNIDYYGDYAGIGEYLKFLNMGDENTFNYHTFPGRKIQRYGTITYTDGAYPHLENTDNLNFVDVYTTIHYANGTVYWEDGYNSGYYSEGEYDGLMTFTFANTKIDNSILNYWLNQKNRKANNGSLYYSKGFMKAVYGSFLEGLLVVYCSDLVADVAAERFNVKWVRTSPMVMSVRDDHDRNIMSGESSFNMGRRVIGDDGNYYDSDSVVIHSSDSRVLTNDSVKAFFFACSASFSPIEHFVGKSLFPGISDNASTTMGLGYLLANNGSLELVFDGDYCWIHGVNDTNQGLIYDNSSGLLRDYANEEIICGAYCYSNQQTDWASDLASELLNKFDQILNYLKGTNNNLDGLNVSTVDLLKSCNGMLGIADLLMGKSLDDAYNQLRLIGLPESLNNIVPIISAVVSGASDYVVDSLSDPKFLAGVAGGIMFEAGMIASMTGVGLPVGLALMGAGTLCTAYSCGLFDFNSKGITFNVTNENINCFVFSMVCNGVSGGYSGIVSRSTFKLAGSEVMQIASRNAVVDSRGLYASTITRKYVVYEGSGNTASKYIINRLVDSQNPVTSDYVKKSIFSSVDYSIQGVIWEYYFKNALNYY